MERIVPGTLIPIHFVWVFSFFGTITGLYIERQHLSDSILYCLAREEFPGRGFSWGGGGGIIAEKRGLAMFWGKCLNAFVTKNASFYNVIVRKYEGVSKSFEPQAFSPFR